MLASLLLAALAGSNRQSAKAVDPCLALIPESVRHAALAAFPEYRMSRANDNDPEDIKYQRNHGGNGCLGAAAGDFNGDGQEDFAFLLTSDNAVILVAALARPHSNWEIQELWTVGSAKERSNLYAAPAPPGRYDDVGIGDVAITPPQLETYTSKFDGVVTGLTESTGIAFFWTKKGWVYVWVKD